MHVTYIRRVRMTWGGKQMIAHLVSTGDLSKWKFKNFVEVIKRVMLMFVWLLQCFCLLKHLLSTTTFESFAFDFF